MRRGFTLIELIIVVLLLAVMGTASIYIFRAVLLSWSSSQERSGIDSELNRATEGMIRDLRKAKTVQSTSGYNEIRFSQDDVTYYIYYLYNANDAYVPPPRFDQGSYKLMKATLSGGIGGSFTYGAGAVKLNDVIPPPTTELSFSSNVATIDLSAARESETIRLKTKVKARNL